MSMTEPEGIINPPIDELLEATDSKYSLVIYAAKRARQINAGLLTAEPIEPTTPVPPNQQI